MPLGLNLLVKGDPESTEYATEMVQSTLRTLIFLTAGVYLVWHLVAVAWPDSFGLDTLWGVLLLSPIVVAVAGLALWLARRRVALSLAVWQVGLAAAVAVGLLQFQRAEILFLLALLPLIAVLAAGWPVSAGSLVFVSMLAFLLPQAPGMPMVPTGYSTASISVGALVSLLGGAARRELLERIHWLRQNNQEVHAKLAEARDQQLELKQTQEDLIHASGELGRLTNRLRAMQEVADEARRTKEEFVANVSHELRTPLNMIIGFSEMITESPQVYGTKLPPALLADIVTIQRNSLQLSKLVDDVLDLSQVDAGRMALTKEWVTIADLIEIAASVVRPLFASKGLSLTTQVEPDLPRVLCDSLRVRQVVINLLSNGGRFTESGGVVVRAWREAGRALIAVEDTGPGIAREDQERLFEPFQQLDSSIRRRHGGTGLGLSISRRFVEMHDGQMWLHSEAGVGTTITFSLPLTGAPADLPEQDARRWFSPYKHFEPRQRRSKAPLSSPTPRYVLLEQEGTLGRILGRYFGEAEVITVSDAESAVEELHRSPAQGLIVNLPPEDQPPSPELSSLPYGTPVLRCWVPGRHETADDLGVERYLVKPVSRDEVLATVDQLAPDASVVLLVDDEVEVLQLFTRMISSASPHVQVLRAQSGQEALRVLRDRHPDLMLLDLIMPGTDGWQVLQEMIRDPSVADIPVAVISSRDPASHPVASDTLAVARTGGLSVPVLLESIRALTGVLTPSVQHSGLARQGTQSERPVC
jgi:signal transduction histidine kinase/CheY-like chemotaxis protein